MPPAPARHPSTAPLLERYLADLSASLSRAAAREHISALNGFLRDTRRHGWDDGSLPATAVFYPEDYPKRGQRLPRALAAHVMAQVEDPANLDRWGNPAYRLITVILIRCGLRISSAVSLPWDCVVTDADGAPYLRYYNPKMKREALVPIDDELRAMISAQHDRVRRQLAGRHPRAVPPAADEPGRNPAGRRRHLPGSPLPLAGRLRHPRRARAPGPPNPPSMASHAGNGPDQPRCPAACRAENPRSRLAAHDRSLCAAVR